MIVDVIGFYIFNDNQMGFEKIAGLLVGVYTGGTPNLASLKIALNVDAETYIFVHTFDMIISFVYLVFLMSFGIRIFRIFLKPQQPTDDSQQTLSLGSDNMGQNSEQPYSNIFSKKHFPKTGKSGTRASNKL